MNPLRCRSVFVGVALAWACRAESTPAEAPLEVSLIVGSRAAQGGAVAVLLRVANYGHTARELVLPDGPISAFRLEILRQDGTLLRTTDGEPVAAVPFTLALAPGATFERERALSLTDSQGTSLAKGIYAIRAVFRYRGGEVATRSTTPLAIE